MMAALVAGERDRACWLARSRMRTKLSAIIKFPRSEGFSIT